MVKQKYSKISFFTKFFGIIFPRFLLIFKFSKNLSENLPRISLKNLSRILLKTSSQVLIFVRAFPRIFRQVWSICVLNFVQYLNPFGQDGAVLLDDHPISKNFQFSPKSRDLNPTSHGTNFVTGKRS